MDKLRFLKYRQCSSRNEDFYSISRHAKKITTGICLYSEDYFLSITQRLGKKTICGWTLNRLSCRQDPKWNLRWSACGNPGIFVFEFFYPSFQIVCPRHQFSIFWVGPKICFGIPQMNPKIEIFSFKMLNTVAMLPSNSKQYVFFRNSCFFHGLFS